ncbi:MAG TPA: ABC transporter permease [Solirubrobacteraceae bacterium]|nr:ABC transporter permease [Solirubrobacteraceae bacterium]
MSVGSVPVESAAALEVGQADVRRREFLHDLVRHKSFWAGVIIIGFWVLAAIFGALVVKDPNAQNLLNINQAPSGAYWFGTDQLGRDMFARVITGSRDILIIAVLATLLGTVVGTVLGLFMGYFRGAVDDVLGRVVEAFLALPLVIVGILGTIALGGASTGSLIVIIGIVFTPLIARTVRAAVLVERDLDYVPAARLRGENSLHIMFVEILPNIMPPVVVEFTVRLSYAVFTLVALSFLGFGVQPPSSDWGLDISNNYGQLPAGYWWEVLFDALAIATLVIGVNMLSTSIESALEG